MGGVSAVRGSLKCHKREEFDASLDPEICSCVEEQSVYLNAIVCVYSQLVISIVDKKMKLTLLSPRMYAWSFPPSNTEDAAHRTERTEIIQCFISSSNSCFF